MDPLDESTLVSDIDGTRLVKYYHLKNIKKL